MSRKSKVISIMKSKLISHKKIKKEKDVINLRWSRRIRHLPPPVIDFNILKNIKLEKSSDIFNKSFGSLTHHRTSDLFRKQISRKMKINMKSFLKPNTADIGVQNSTSILNHSLTKPRSAKVFIRTSKATHNIANADEVHVKIGRCFSTQKTTLKKLPSIPLRTNSSRKLQKSSSPIDVDNPRRRKDSILQILNYGNIRDIQKLQSIGRKTAKSILLFRRIRGPFQKIAELAKLPAFHKTQYKQFIAKNYLI